MQGRLAICARLSVLALALFACSSNDSTVRRVAGPTNRRSRSRVDGPSLPPGPMVSSQRPGASVTIPAGKAVLLDVSPPALAASRSTARWCSTRKTSRSPPDRSSSPERSESARAAHRSHHNATITLTGASGAPDVMGMGSKVLGVLPGGTLDLHGQARTGWTRLGVDGPAGATQLSFAPAPGMARRRSHRRRIHRFRPQPRRSRHHSKRQRNDRHADPAAALLPLRRATDLRRHHRR